MIIISKNPNRVRPFDKQFEPDGDGFLYRRLGKGPPIRITALERSEFSATYTKVSNRTFWGATVLLMVGVALAGTLTYSEPTGSSKFLLYTISGVYLATLTLLLRRAMAAPASFLERRSQDMGSGTRP